MRMTTIFKGVLIALLGVMCFSQAVLAQAPPEARATFLVAKAYDDFNPAPVEVTISCNTGLPLEQTTTIDPTYDVNDVDFVEFVVVDFESGAMDCEIFETVPGGYFAAYVMADENQITLPEDACLFENVEHGDVATFDPPDTANNLCGIGNFPIPSVVTVTKEWIDENPAFNPVNFGEATYSCTNLPDVDGDIDIIVPITGPDAGEGIAPPSSGFLQFLGNPGQDSFVIFGNWDGGTQCTVTETFVEGGIESDDSDCANIVVFPGEDAECTIVNTRLFEGIPTLSQYGLALLAMLMLGVGFVAYRRFI